MKHDPNSSNIKTQLAMQGINKQEPANELAPPYAVPETYTKAQSLPPNGLTKVFAR
jgi:hypothetical protein